MSLISHIFSEYSNFKEFEIFLWEKDAQWQKFQTQLIIAI